RTPKKPPRPWKQGPSLQMDGKNKDSRELAEKARRRKHPQELQQTIDGIKRGTKTASDSLRAMGTDTVPALKNTKHYGRSGGLKQLVKLVEEIAAEYAAVDQRRAEAARNRTPLDFDGAYGPLLAKIAETQRACDAYIKDHEEREGRDEQSN